MSISIVVPCYRSARTIPTLVERLNDVMPNVASDYEVILVVDSPDDTWDVASELALKHDHVQAIRMARNYGQHNALIAGVRAARCELIITMDDDLQHPPEEIPQLLAALTDDLDLVYALFEAEEHGAVRNFLSRAAKAGVFRAMGVQDASMLSAFRIFRTFLRTGFEQVHGPDVSVDVALSWTTTRVGSVTVRMDDRIEGDSGYNFGSLVKHALNMMMGYTTKPLRMVTYLGLMVGACGLLLAIRLLWQYYHGDTKVAGFTTIASMVAIFSAAQMIGIGVLGEYLGRVHSRGMGRPTYVVRERVGAPGREQPPGPVAG